jgi:hypothetical protein
MKCLNPRCAAEFAKDAAGRYAFELVYTGIDQAFVCPVCQHWNRVLVRGLDLGAGSSPNMGTHPPSTRMDPRTDL